MDETERKLRARNLIINASTALHLQEGQLDPVARRELLGKVAISLRAAADYLDDEGRLT